jgi:hypothetical protein
VIGVVLDRRETTSHTTACNHEHAAGDHPCLLSISVYVPVWRVFGLIITDLVLCDGRRLASLDVCAPAARVLTAVSIGARLVSMHQEDLFSRGHGRPPGRRCPGARTHRRSHSSQSHEPLSRCSRVEVPVTTELMTICPSKADGLPGARAPAAVGPVGSCGQRPGRESRARWRCWDGDDQRGNKRLAYLEGKLYPSLRSIFPTTNVDLDLLDLPRRS